MKRLDRRSFTLLVSAGGAGAILTACGKDPKDVDLNPTMISVEGAPPTLAPNATPGGGAVAEPSKPEAGGGSAAGATSAEIDAFDLGFKPTEVTIAADTEVTLTLKNTGVLDHDLIIENTEFGTDLVPGGSSAELKVNLAAGDYTYYCSVPGHREAGMEGTLHVVAGGGEEEAAPATEEEAAGGEAAGAATSAEVKAFDLGFDPKELTIAADTEVTITLNNTGVLDHDLLIENTEFGTDMAPGGSSAELKVNLAAGDYTYYCSVPGHREAGMEGTLHVVAGGGEKEAAPATEEEAAGGEAAGAATSAEVEAFDLGFKPTEVTIAADTEVTITLNNTGVLDHDLIIENTEFGTDMVPGGGSAELKVNLAAGDYAYYCSVPGHRDAGMVGTLHVVAAGGESAAPASEGSPASAGSLEPVIVEAVDPFQWSIGALSVAPGQVIRVVNTGLLQHDFVVDELAINAPLPIGETVDVTVPDDAKVGDTYEFYCSVAGHRASGMKGTITIVAAPTGPEAQGGPSEEIALPSPEVESDIRELMEDPTVVALEATDPYNWSWKSIEAYPGQIIRVLNLGVLEHDFAIDEWDVQQALPFGEPIDIQVPLDVKPGDTFVYYCTIPGHRELGMEGTLTIIAEGGTASPEAVGATPSASPVASPEAAAGGGEITVEAGDIFYSITEISGPANADFTIHLVNKGVLEHDLVIPDLNLETALLKPGEEGSITVNAPAGKYEFWCTVAGHKQLGMDGWLTLS